MQPYIRDHADEISELCRKFGVVRLDLFGSAARGDFDPVASDIDLVASFARTSEAGYADRYLDFAESLEALFGRKVDLLTPGAIRNPRFAERIERETVRIYESKDDQAA